MPDFESQLIALIDSTILTCERADTATWNGDGWTPAIILGHLVEVDNEVWLSRFVLMVEAAHRAKPAPQLKWWEPDPLETAEKYSAFTLAQAQQNAMVGREVLVSYLRALPLIDRLASANHSTFGEITIDSMLQVILDHDEEHRDSL
jgi:hypothetical protein